MRICFFGDSFVNGTGDPHFQGWVGRVCASLSGDVTAYNLGIRRDTSAQIAARWRAEAEARLPPEEDGRLVFSFGVNDCVQGAADTLAHARAILTEAAAWKPTLMVGPPPVEDAAINARIAVLSANLEALCGELGVPYLAIYADLHADVVWMAEVAAGDGAHPGAAGYAVLVALILKSRDARRGGAPSPFFTPRPR